MMYVASAVIFTGMCIYFDLRNGILLNSEEKQQDFFGCLARFLGCQPREGPDNPEIEARPPKRSRGFGLTI